MDCCVVGREHGDDGIIDPDRGWQFAIFRFRGPDAAELEDDDGDDDSRLDDDDDAML